MALFLMGLPGAGKSTLAHALSRKLGWPVVDRDDVRLRLFRKPRFTPAEKHAANARVCTLARRHLSAQRSVIVDGMTFAAPSQRRRVARLARASGARPVFVFVDCPVALAQSRVGSSAVHPAGDRSAELVLEVAARFRRPASALRLDARRRASELARRLLRALQKTEKTGVRARFFSRKLLAESNAKTGL